MKPFESTGLKYDGKKLWVLDQTQLPDREEWVDCRSTDHMVELIQKLSVRGAPLIGVAAACSLALHSKTNSSPDSFQVEADKLRASRPTAVNLMRSIDRVLSTSQKNSDGYLAEAQAIFDDEVKMSEQMAKNGAALVRSGEGILTHCNTGGLATTGSGTALAVIAEAHRQNKNIHVYVDETRPLLQGGRLTTWELERMGVPYTLICDNMAAILMAEKKINRVFVGADRIALNGDFANKVGTYSVAVNAKYHGVDFHPVAPESTIDPECKSGAGIPIEQRADIEVRGVRGSFGDVRWSPESAKTFNPAFDVTPAALVTSLVLDSGVYTSEELQKTGLNHLFRS